MNARDAAASALGEVELTDSTPGGVGEDFPSATGLAAESGDTSYRTGRRMRRDTRRWCAGKVGRPHEFVLRETVGAIFGLPALHVWACTRCGRKVYNLKVSRHRTEI